LVTNKIETLLWHPRGERLPAIPRAGVRVVRFSYAILRDVLGGHLTLHATGLVYVTILSLVPLLAVSFSVLKGFGFHRQLQPLLYEFFAPLGTRGAELTDRIIGFVDNVQGDVLAGIGLILLFLTAISMAEKIEGSFNYVWRVTRPRSLARRMSEYLSVILVGPVVMVTAMTLIATLRSTTFAQRVARLAPLEAGDVASELAPYVLVCLAFAFVYWLVPNTRVRPVAAFTGGLVGGVLWAATGALFATFVVTAATTINVYATFAIVISALLWLYLSWLILLVGSQVAFYVQNPGYLRVGYRPPVSGTAQQEQAALGVMLMIAAAFRDGRRATRVSDLSQMTGLPGLAVDPVLDRLEEAGLLARTAREALLPARDPGRILLRDILHAVRHPRGADVGPAIRWPPALDDLHQRLTSAVEKSLGSQTLADLVEQQADPLVNRTRPSKQPT
jgi:membrane protein